MKKPKCEIFKTGDRFIHALGERVTFVLRMNKQYPESVQFNDRLWCCCNWIEALALAGEYVEVIEFSGRNFS
jgi:hypothetical protein